MKSVLSLDPRDYRELVTQTAAKMGIQPAIVEKDVWLCVVLERIFADPTYKDRFVFKGGTSLSKVYKVIRRFSEDIDLILDWRLLGYEADQSELKKKSRSQQDRLNNEINQKARGFIANTLLPWLSASLTDIPDLVATASETDTPAIEIRFPALFAPGYVPDRILLEIGPLAAWVPSEMRSITPYVAEQFPNVVGDIRIPLRVTSIERTFWEKATILHQQACRSGEIPPRYSRHYYDLYMIAQTGAAAKALSSPALLDEVVAFKSQFYPSASARYDLAKPGTFRLVPDSDKMRGLKRDYGEMQVMIFGNAPDWDRLVAGLLELEHQINSMTSEKE